jgi:hypothetical protein
MILVKNVVTQKYAVQQKPARCSNIEQAINKNA